MQDWQTPQELFDKLNAEFDFEVDVCAIPGNAKCPTFFTPQQNGLSKSWNYSRVWMNPPYGKEIGAWMRKAHNESITWGATIVCLIPNRSNAPWWHDWCMKADEIRFIRKKVPFVGEKRGVPLFGSCIVIFRGIRPFPPRVSSWDQPLRLKKKP